MNFCRSRRSVMLGMASLGIGPTLLQEPAKAQSVASGGYVLGPTEGEHLIQRGGNIFIKADPTKGCDGLAMGTQQVLAGVGIPIHRHFQMDEAFFVVEGGGTFILNDVRHAIDKGSSIFIPKNAWHGFENVDRELILLWIVAPPGLEAFFREVAARPGVPATPRTKEQLNEIARKYATEFR
jgi:quercetin dioxygenase-like cupin family protein